jgi:hypothetical protein
MQRLIAVVAPLLLTGCFLFRNQPSTVGGAAAPAPESAGQSGTPNGGAVNPPASDAGSQSYSLTLHNECPNTVKLAVGNTHTSLSSNTQTSYSGSLSDTIAIEDESEKQLSVYTPRAGRQEMKILSSCTGFAPY